MPCIIKVVILRLILMHAYLIYAIQHNHVISWSNKVMDSFLLFSLINCGSKLIKEAWEEITRAGYNLSCSSWYSKHWCREYYLSIKTMGKHPLQKVRDHVSFGGLSINVSANISVDCRSIHRPLCRPRLCRESIEYRLSIDWYFVKWCFAVTHVLVDRSINSRSR